MSVLIRQVQNFRGELLRLDEQAQQTLNQTWLALEQRLYRELIDLLTDIEARGIRSPSQLYQLQRFQTLLQQIDSELLIFNERAARDLESRQQAQQRAAFLASLSWVQRRARELGIPYNDAVGVTFDRMNPLAVEAMLGILADGSPLRQVLNEVSLTTTAAIASLMVQGVAQGEHPMALARKLIDLGLATNLQRVQSIMRTELLRASREASLEGYRRSGVVVGYQRMSALSLRSCIGCIVTHGRKYPLSVPFEEHPNGRCYPVPVLDWTEDLDPQLDGQEWFDNLPPADQRRIMPPGALDLYNAGRVDWGQLATRRVDPVWGNSIRPTTLGDLLLGHGGLPADEHNH